MTRAVRSTFLTAAILLAILISVYALSYLTLTETGFLRSKDRTLTSNILWRISFYSHVAFGAVALLIGGFQFIGGMRNRYAALHRGLGKIYVVSVFAASTTAFAISPFSDGGLVAKIGFACLALAWFFTNYKAYTTIRQGDVSRHRKWMIRNYALTFAAVTLRIWLPLELAVAGINYYDAYRIVAWVCWVPNLLVAESCLQRRFLPRYRREHVNPVSVRGER